MSSIGSTLSSLRNQLKSAANSSAKAAGGFGSLATLGTAGAEQMKAVKGQADDAYYDSEEIDSSSYGRSACNGLGAASETGSSAAGAAGNVSQSGGDSLEALQGALSIIDGLGSNLNSYALNSHIKSALSSQGEALSSLGGVVDAVKTAQSAIERAADDARFVSADEPGKDITNHADSLGRNASGAASAFSSVNYSAGWGGSQQNSAGNHISGALGEVDTLERALQRMVSEMDEKTRETERSAEEQKAREGANVPAPSQPWAPTKPWAPSQPIPGVSSGSPSTPVAPAYSWNAPSAFSDPALRQGLQALEQTHIQNTLRNAQMVASGNFGFAMPGMMPGMMMPGMMMPGMMMPGMMPFGFPMPFAAPPMPMPFTMPPTGFFGRF